jgi:hypothetical protein
MTVTRCDIIHYVKNYIKPIMQALTMQITDYNMRLITTKCLNTAVTFMVLFFGEKNGLQTTEYCDVDNVRRRHTTRNNTTGRIDRNPELVKALAADVLADSDVRCIYYVMLTNGTFVKSTNTYNNNNNSLVRRGGGPEVNFPGHVMVWEKVPVAGGPPKYYIYQSYINEYEYKGSPSFQQKRNHITYDTMHYFMATLTRYMQKPQPWDDDMVRFWTTLTGVDTSDMLGAKPRNAFFLCWRKRPHVDCLQNLHTFVKQTLKRIPRSQLKQDETYGNVTMYNTTSKPLSNSQMLDAFTRLDNELTTQFGNARVARTLAQAQAQAIKNNTRRPNSNSSNTTQSTANNTTTNNNRRYFLR